MENLGLGGNFMEMQQRMQQALLQNPDALRQVIDNPLVQQLMNDPNNVRQLLLSNPQMQDIIEVCTDDDDEVAPGNVRLKEFIDWCFFCALVSAPSRDQSYAK